MKRKTFSVFSSVHLSDSLQSFFKRIKTNKWFLPILVFILALGVISFLLIHSVGKQKILVATDASWPPFESKDPASQKIVGFDIDLMNAIAAKENLEVEYVNVGFDQIMTNLANCKYDAAISLIAVSDQRKEVMLFSNPYFQLGQLLTVRSTDTIIQGKDSLSGKKVGAQIGTAGANEMGKISGAMLITYDSVDQAYTALENGELDAVVSDNTLALNFIGHSQGKLKAAGGVFAGKDIAVAVCKNKPDLLKRINNGLASMTANGELNKLINQWIATPA
jgi:polar amino acid transport system substrate-binding protein